MSIKVPALTEAGPFQVTAPVIPGYIKNDTAGNFLFGQAAPGGGGPAWTFLEHLVIPITNASGIADFTSVLDGDTDEIYQIYFIASSLTDIGGSFNLDLRINGTSTFNATNGTVRTNHALYDELALVTPNAFVTFRIAFSSPSFAGAPDSGVWGRLLFYAKRNSPGVRTGWGYTCNGRPSSAQPRSHEYSIRWNNGSALPNVTSIGFSMTVTSTWGNSRFWIFKKAA